MRFKKTFIAVAVLLALSLSIAPSALGLSGELVIEGAGDGEALLKDIAGRFARVHPNVSIVIPDAVGSTGGIAGLRKREIALARVSRHLTEAEKREGFVLVVFARSPVAFATHPGVEGVGSITPEQAVEIYSGKITRWGELGVNSKFKIYPVGMAAGDGSRLALGRSIKGFSDAESPMVKAALSAPEAARLIMGHKNTIGYLPVSAAHRSGLRVLKLGGVDPSAENVRSGRYAPSVPLGVVYKKELKDPLARAFVNFLFDPAAQDLIRKYGCAPAERPAL